MAKNRPKTMKNGLKTGFFAISSPKTASRGSKIDARRLPAMSNGGAPPRRSRNIPASRQAAPDAKWSA